MLLVYQFRLATSCSRFPKKLSDISQKGAQKLLFVTKVAKRAKHFRFSFFIWSDAKIYNLYNKSNISKHFCAILRCKINQAVAMLLFIKQKLKLGGF